MIWELVRIPHAESQIWLALHGVLLWEDLKLETSWIPHWSPRKHQLGEEHYQVTEPSHAKFVMAGSSLVADLSFCLWIYFWILHRQPQQRGMKKCALEQPGTNGTTIESSACSLELLSIILIIMIFLTSDKAPLLHPYQVPDMPMFHCSRLDHSGGTWHCSSWAWQASIQGVRWTVADVYDDIISLL